jgi:hypothetical protein
MNSQIDFEQEDRDRTAKQARRHQFSPRKMAALSQDLMSDPIVDSGSTTEPRLQTKTPELVAPACCHRW